MLFPMLALLELVQVGGLPKVEVGCTRWSYPHLFTGKFSFSRTKNFKDESIV